jgi:hypothetical protein
MSDQDIADMRRAARVLDAVDAPRWGTILRDVAAAAEPKGPVSLAEQMRWTPVVVHCAELARAVILAAGHTAEVVRVP